LIKIEADGSAVTFLYDDKLPTKEIGTMKCVRASDVYFDEHKQRWKIKLNKDLQKGLQFIQQTASFLIEKLSFQTRSEAINAEIEFMENVLLACPKCVADIFHDCPADLILNMEPEKGNAPSGGGPTGHSG
jgi:hypothetical protein